MPDRPLRVALLNDYEIVVEGLARMLEPFDSRVRVVDLGVATAADAGPRTDEVDVTLYDSFSRTHVVGRSLQDLLARTGARHLVVYSWNLEPRLVEESIKLGASGYLAKSLPAAELLDALERITRGEVVVSPPDAYADPAGGDWPGRQAGLTAREAEIIALITQGLSNQQIAERAFLSINSVKSYIRSGYRKMDVDSRSRAVLWGIAHGLRPDQPRPRPVPGLPADRA